jgi:protein CpxP
MKRNDTRRNRGEKTAGAPAATMTSIPTDLLTRLMMRPWIKRTLIGAFGATMLVGGLAACGHHRHQGGWQMSEADEAKIRERVIGKATRELELDAAQQAKLNALADTVKAQRAALRSGSSGSGQAPRDVVQGLIAGAQFDRAKAQALVEQKTSAVREGSPAVITAFGDFYDALRPEQQQKVRDFLQRGHGHRHFWRG